MDTFVEYIDNGIRSASEFRKEPTTIELLPPAIFKAEIVLEDETNLDDLSSGEKQQIHSVSSIIYHLINLNSVSKNGEDPYDVGKIVQNYRNVNILFDEVEQYFHPDLQRTFLASLIEYIDRMNPRHLEKIDAINMLFVSHSPFILSDILNVNCLFLEVNEKDKHSYPVSVDIQSFGANINDMLKQNFFMSSTMGGHTEQKISELIEFYQLAMREDEPELIKFSQQYKAVRSEFVELTDIIGEPVVKGILKNHLRVMDRLLLGEEEENNNTQARIEALEKEIESLKHSTK